jgi:hypothetical protein
MGWQSETVWVHFSHPAGFTDERRVEVRVCQRFCTVWSLDLQEVSFVR